MTGYRDRVRRRAADGPAALAEKVAFLKDPAHYPDSPETVEAIESHMSWVFLTDRYAYKLKKPVRFPFLDFSTLEARRKDCRAEVRLNRRLAPDVYLGTVSLTRGPEGSFRLGGTGEAVEWLVHMRRLDRDLLLDRRIRAGALKREDLKGAARLLADFYAAQRPVRIGVRRYLDRFAADIAENQRELTRPEFGLPAERIERLAGRLAEFAQGSSALLLARRAEGRIIEAHGDLRPEHVWLGRPPAVIDCLEFNRDFRLLDPAEELSFLAMECEQAGAGWVGEVFLSAYREATGDAPPAPLLAFYRSCRALLRAKLAVWHLEDGDVRSPDKWRRAARRYLEVAERHVRVLDRDAA